MQPPPILPNGTSAHLYKINKNKRKFNISYTVQNNNDIYLIYCHSPMNTQYYYCALLQALWRHFKKIQKYITEILKVNVTSIYQILTCYQQGAYSSHKTWQLHNPEVPPKIQHKNAANIFTL
jgi:hypothetical protein